MYETSSLVPSGITLLISAHPHTQCKQPIVSVHQMEADEELGVLAYTNLEQLLEVIVLSMNVTTHLDEQKEVWSLDITLGV